MIEDELNPWDPEPSTRVKKGAIFVAAGTGSTLHELSMALRAAEQTEEHVLDLIARGAKWSDKSDIRLTGEAITERDVLDIARCRVEQK